MSAPDPATDGGVPLRQSPTHYFETEEKLVISIDIGNTASSVTLAHLSWGTAPLSSSSTSAPCIRSVLTYPYSSPHLTLGTSARVPSLIAYDRDNQPRAFGNECLTDQVKHRIEDGSWMLVKGWKEQMRPRSPSESQRDEAVPASQTSTLEKTHTGTARKLLTKAKMSPRTAAEPATSGLRPMSRRQSLATIGAVPGFSTSSEQLLDAADALAEHTAQLELSPSPRRFATIDGGTGALGDFSARKPAAAAKKGGESRTALSGPRLRDIYAAFLRYLVACARAWFSEAVQGGEAIFLRLWSSCTFVLAIPADWTSSETDLLRQAVEDAKLLAPDFELARLDGSGLILVEATGTGITAAGYETLSSAPRLRYRTHGVIRLRQGSEEVVARFRQLVANRLARTRIKSDAVVDHLVGEFCGKLLSSFTGVNSGPASFELRIQGRAGDTKDWMKLEKAIDSGASIRDGVMSFDAQDIEDVFRPVVDELLICLSALIPRSKAKSLLLFGAFGDSPYLRNRLSNLNKINLLFPTAAPHLAVSEGALRLYLSASLQQRRLRHAIGVETAVDWSRSWSPGLQNREVTFASDGQRVVRGKFTAIAQEGEVVEASKCWLKPFHLKYRLAAKDPSFTTTLFVRASKPESPEPHDWMNDEQQRPYPQFKCIGTVRANLADLVAEQPVQEADNREKAWVQLEVSLRIEVTAEGLSASAAWQTKASEQRSAPLRIPLEEI